MNRDSIDNVFLIMSILMVFLWSGWAGYDLVNGYFIMVVLDVALAAWMYNMVQRVREAKNAS